MSKIETGQFEFKETSKKGVHKSIIEAMLFVSGEPLTLREIAINLEATPKYVEEVLTELIEDYEVKERGIKLILLNGGYQLVTKAEHCDYIQKLLKKNKRQSLSQASLESLAIVAYKQPITRIDIDEIRGVKSDSAIQRLLEKELIREVGRLEVPGRPIIYGTSEEFLRQFGLQDLKELPSLELFSYDDEIEENSDFDEEVEVEEVEINNDFDDADDEFN